ncbi:MAG: GNAT family N-acetyltransferase [Solirubrobacteraceae bacterium]
MLTAAQRAEAESIWIGLETEISSSGVMCSWGWTGTWLAHYGDVVPHRFVFAESDGVPCGIALITESASHSRLRPPTIALGTACEPPGSSVFVERNRLLARPEDRRAFAAELMGELQRDSRWQRLRLDGMTLDETELLIDGRSNVRRRTDESPVADLLAGEEHDVLTALPTSKRQRVRRALKHLGTLDAHWAQSAQEANSMLDELIVLHNARWQAEAQPGAFASARFTAFHRELISLLLPTGRAALFRVKRDGETIGCLYGLIEGDRMLFYQGGLQRFEDNRMRVGIAAHALFMQACRERGLSKYDFLAPAARYKSDLSTSSEQLVWAELERPGARLRIERAARKVKHRLRSGSS